MKERIVKKHIPVVLKKNHLISNTIIVGFILLIFIALFIIQSFRQQILLHSSNEQKLKQQLTKISKQVFQAQKDLHDLQNQDQYKINKNLEADIHHIHNTYMSSLKDYEKIQDLKLAKSDTKDIDALFTQTLSYLSDKNYASAEATLSDLGNTIQKEEDKIAVAAAAAAQANAPQPVANAPANNNLQGGGFSVQKVSTGNGDFTLSIVAADLNSTRVIVDTASDGDCSNNCPALPLADFVARSGAFAGINGTFFCPPEYPSCAGKTNSFDTLLMNKNKHYINSANNVYSTVPLVFFSGNTMGVRGQSSNWGRDTGVDSVIAMQPLLVSGGNIAFTSSSDTKFTNKGTRDFIAAKGSTVYIGVIYNANMSDAAVVLKVLGVDNALNLDEGGSTALWSGGYKAGPGRNIPNAVLFVRK